MKCDKNLTTLITHLKVLWDSGELGREQVEAQVLAFKRLRHAIRVKDFRQVEAAVNQIAKSLLRRAQK